MSALSPRVVEEFCKLCDWAYQVWLNHRTLFDDNPRATELQGSIGADALARLSAISHEYSLLQVAKLHDRAVVAGEVTLGVEYIVKYGGWSQSTSARLAELSAKLNDFAQGLRSVRNRALSHNDLAAVLSGATLGEFNKDEDIEYFSVLQELVNLVHSEAVGGPFPFNELAKNDAIALLAMMKS
jgi:hypothetical protein